MLFGPLPGRRHVAVKTPSHFHLSPNPCRLLSAKETCQLVGLSRSSVYDLINDPDPGRAFPKPIKAGPRRSRWVETEIYAWIERQKARRFA
jgi:predicted DNA-binding transcriptional regulator AlpA